MPGNLEGKVNELVNRPNVMGAIQRFRSLRSATISKRDAEAVAGQVGLKSISPTCLKTCLTFVKLH